MNTCLGFILYRNMFDIGYSYPQRKCTLGNPEVTVSQRLLWGALWYQIDVSGPPRSLPGPDYGQLSVAITPSNCSVNSHATQEFPTHGTVTNTCFMKALSDICRCQFVNLSELKWVIESLGPGSGPLAWLFGGEGDSLGTNVCLVWESAKIISILEG